MGDWASSLYLTMFYDDFNMITIVELFGWPILLSSLCTFFCSLEGSSSAPPSAGVGPPPPQAAMLGGDRYAALAALDTAFSTPAPNSSSFGTATSTQG